MRYSYFFCLFFNGMVSQRKLLVMMMNCFFLILSPLQTSTLQVGFEPALNLCSGFVELSCAVVTTIPWCNEKECGYVSSPSNKIESVKYRK